MDAVYHAPQDSIAVTYTHYALLSNGRAKLRQISVGSPSDTNMWGIDSNGRLFRFMPQDGVKGQQRASASTVTKEVWCLLTAIAAESEERLRFSSLSAGDSGELWAVSTEKKLYKRKHAVLEGTRQKSTQVEEFVFVDTGDIKPLQVSLARNRVFMINEHGSIFYHEAQKANSMFTTQSLFSTVFGSNVDWRRVATGSHSFVQVHVGASGEVWAIDTDGKPFRMVSYEDDYDEENELSIVSMMSCSEPSSRDIVKNRPTSTNTGNTIDLFPQFEEPNGLSMDSPLGIAAEWEEYFFGEREESNNRRRGERETRTALTRISVGSRKIVWCVDAKGTLYVRFGSCQRFRPVRFTRGDTAYRSLVERMLAGDGESADDMKETCSFVVISGGFGVDDEETHTPTVPTVMPVILQPRESPYAASSPSLPPIDSISYGTDFRFSSVAVNSSGEMRALTQDSSLLVCLNVRSLMLTNVTQYKKVWDDRGTAARLCDLSIYRPLPYKGYVSFGDVAERSHLDYPLTFNFERPTCAIALVGKERASKDGDPTEARMMPLLLPPEGYEKVWDSASSFPEYGHVTIWRPLPPKGYVALGCIATAGLTSHPGSAASVSSASQAVLTHPSTSRGDGERAFSSTRCSSSPVISSADKLYPPSLMCVHHSLINPASLYRCKGSSQGMLWNTDGINSTRECSLWLADVGSDGGVSPGSFFTSTSAHAAPPKNLLWVLNAR